MTPIEQHLAQFLRANPGPAFRAYRERCLVLWREKYGEAVSSRARALAEGGKHERDHHALAAA